MWTTLSLKGSSGQGIACVAQGWSREMLKVRIAKYMTFTIITWENPKSLIQ